MINTLPSALTGSNGHLSGENFVFVIGAPRSGTTWLHHMIAEHSGVASTRHELTLFSRYLAPVVAGYDREKGHADRGEWEQGLPTLFGPEAIGSGLSTMIDTVYARVLEGNPTAIRILDKHPGYCFHLPLIERLLPGARFIHIVRDGRDVAVSMMSARVRLGFGADNIADCAREWTSSVVLAQRFGGSIGPRRYLELRYEEATRDTAKHLARIFDFCGTAITADECQRIAEANHISQKQVSRGNDSVNSLRGRTDAIW
ncbi:MAG TPA: sulfotransferase, partial [Flavobacteriales bacterium]|nr:sulfotransferase [Flavobacteriales bacterium]